MPLKIATDHMPDGQEWLDACRAGKSTGIPFLTWISPRGKITGRGFDGAGNNIGYPYTAAEVTAFMKLFKEHAPRATPEEAAQVEKTLRARGEEGKAKR